jgi:hypothetical protein
LTGNPLLAEIIEVEAGISRYRQTSRNLSNYIPLLRYVNPALSAIGIGESNNDGAKMGARRVAYHDVLLRQLKQRIESGSDLPCIQGAVLKDPEAKLNETELLSVSLSMMAVSFVIPGERRREIDKCRVRIAVSHRWHGQSCFWLTIPTSNKRPTVQSKVLGF